MSWNWCHCDGYCYSYFFSPQGIHLDEKTCPAWDYTAYAPNALHASPSTPVSAGAAHNTPTSPPGQGQTKPKATRQWSYSESDKVDTPPHIHSSPCLHTSSKERKTSGGRAHFTIGPESDEHEGQGQSTSIHSGQKSQKHEGHKSRLKKILRPLHRSHSAGSAKDIPGNTYTKAKMEVRSLSLILVWCFFWVATQKFCVQIEELVQERRNSSALALELCLSLH